MKIIGYVLEKDLLVKSDTVVMGQIIGKVRVKSNSELILKGFIYGDLNIEKDACCIIHGTVIGNIRNEGNLKIFGTVHGEIKNVKGTSKIDSTAMIYCPQEKGLKSYRNIILKNSLQACASLDFF